METNISQLISRPQEFRLVWVDGELYVFEKDNSSAASNTR